VGSKGEVKEKGRKREGERSRSVVVMNRCTVPTVSEYPQ